MVLRGTKGIKLTHTEVDNNFQELLDANTASNSDILVNTNDIADHETRVTTLEGAGSGGSLVSTSLAATLSGGYYDNEYELLTFNYAGEEITIKYDITAELSTGGKNTFCGLLVIPAAALTSATDLYAIDTGTVLQGGVSDNWALVDWSNLANYKIRLKKNIDGTCKLFLNNVGNSSTDKILCVYEVLTTTLGNTVHLNYNLAM